MHGLVTATRLKVPLYAAQTQHNNGGCRGDGDSGCTVLPCPYKILTVHYPALIDYNTVLLVVSSCWWFVIDKNGNVKSNTNIRDDMVFKAGRPSGLVLVKCSH